MESRSVVVTGVSTGIGNGTLRELIRAGYRVFGSVRRREDADRLSKEFGEAFVPLIFDVTDAAALAKGAETVRQALGKELLAGLVNNAGVAVAGPLMELTVEEFRRQIEVNLVSVFSVTRAFFPLLRTPGESGPGARIVNISSVAGQFALPFLGPYAASKHGVEGLSDSLRRECMLFGIDVVVIDPGNVATPIWNKAEALDISGYARSPYFSSLTRMREAMVSNGRRGMPPERIGRLVVKILGAKKPRVRYILGGQRMMVWISRNILGPRRTDRLIAGRMGLNRPS